MRLRITGDDELVGRLQALDKTGARITKRAIAAAVQPIIEDAKRRVEPISPTIADAIDFEQKLKNKGQYHYIRIGAVTDQSKTTVKAQFNPITGRVQAKWHNPSKTAHLVEKGTKPHSLRIYGSIRIKHPGAKPYPHLIPALEQNEALVEAVFAREAQAGIERELSKRAKKAVRIQKKANKLLAQGAPE
jgi:HK97 gp10 family phage protein